MATNGNEPATKADLAQLRDEIHGDMGKLRDELIERLRDTETKLLTAFYAFAETNQKRMAQMDNTDVMLVSRVASIETRLIEVEKRLNMPPGH
jgi:hypothetical protein